MVERRAVVRTDDHEAHHLGRVLRQHLADGEEVAERLRHLLVVDRHEAVVQPIAGEALAARRPRLRDLVLMVRELEVHAAAMDVEVLAEAGVAHHRALDVPTRPADAPGAVPVGLARLGVLPQHEVERIPASARRPRPARRRAGPPGPCPRAGRSRRTRTPCSRRRRTCPHRHGRCPRASRIIRTIPTTCWVARGSLVGFSQLSAAKSWSIASIIRPASAAIGSPLSLARLMILSSMVGDVADVLDLIARGLEVALDHIEHHDHPRVPEMAEVVDGDAANVHPHLARHTRGERLLLA